VMSADEFDDWVAYNSLNQIGELRADLRAAIVAETIANCNRARGTTAYKREDFMPFLQAEKPKQTDEDIATSVMQWAMVMNGLLSRKKKG